MTGYFSRSRPSSASITTTRSYHNNNCSYYFRKQHNDNQFYSIIHHHKNNTTMRRINCLHQHQMMMSTIIPDSVRTTNNNYNRFHDSGSTRKFHNDNSSNNDINTRIHKSNNNNDKDHMRRRIATLRSKATSSASFISERVSSKVPLTTVNDYIRRSVLNQNDVKRDENRSTTSIQYSYYFNKNTKTTDHLCNFIIPSNRHRGRYTNLLTSSNPSFDKIKTTLIRWNSSTNNNNNDKNGKDKNDSPMDSTNGASEANKPIKTTTASNISPKEDTVEHMKKDTKMDDESMKTNKSTEVLWNAQMEERFRHIVYDLYPGMLVSGLLVLLFMAPFMITKMKESTISNSSSTAVDIYEDPIDEFVKLARHEWDSTFSDVWDRGTDIDGTDENEMIGKKTKNVLEKIVIDILNAKGVREASQQFVIQIITSEQFKNALQILIKELWYDIINDPETVQQVINILQIAILDPVILKATQQLLIQLIDDPIIRQKVIDLIISLGNEKAIQNSVVELITESAHITLSDPDILDHSMEFATDVVGDDIVQQTAGVALRNTFQHAFQTPIIIVILTSIGVTLLFFSIISIGYSRSSDTDAILIKHVVKSLQTNTTFGIHRIMTWPIRTVSSISFYIYSNVIDPIIQTIYETSYHITGYIISLINDNIIYVITTIQENLHYMFINVPQQMLSNMYQSIMNMFSHSMTSVLQIPSHIVSTFNKMAISFMKQSNGMLVKLFSYINGILSHTIHDIWTILHSSYIDYNHIIISSIEKKWDITLDYLVLLEQQCYDIIKNVDMTYDIHNETMQSILKNADNAIVAIYWKIEEIIQKQISLIMSRKKTSS